MQRSLITFLASLLIVGSAFAQPAIEWEHTFGGSGFGFGLSAVALGDGYAVAGTTMDMDLFETDLVLHRTDLDGNLAWSLIFGGPGEQEMINAIRLIGNEMAVIAYSEDLDNPGSVNVVYYRINEAGDEVLDTHILADGNQFDVSRATATMDHGILLSGLSIAEHEDLIVRKYNILGELEWEYMAGLDNEDDGAGNAFLMPDGGFLVVGFTWSLGDMFGHKYGLVIRLDADGNQEWISTTVENTGYAYGCLLPNGQYAIAGHNDGAGNSQFQLTILNADGQMDWQNWGGDLQLEDEAFFVAPTDDGGFMLAGRTGTDPDNPDTWDMSLCKFSAGGLEEWFNSFPEPGLQFGEVLLADDGGLIFGGTSGFFEQGPLELWLAKIGTGVVGVDESDEPGAAIPTSPIFVRAWPNPFNASARLSLNLPRAESVRVSVSDILGREVAVIAYGPMNAGLHELSFNASAIPTGVYYLRAETSDGESSVAKVTVVR